MYKKIEFIFFIFIFCCNLYADSLAFWDPNQCYGCHKDQVKDWRSSWHSKSHEVKNALYHESINFVAKSKEETKEKTILECATCHNPRIDVKHVDEDYIYAKMFELYTEKTKLIDEAIKSDHIQNGISCYVCHRIYSIKPKVDLQTDVGYKIIEWITDNTMAGPFPSNDRTIFHKTLQRDHFINANKLCEICHQGQGSHSKLSTYNTGYELAETKSTQKCIDCHMGEQIEAVNAPGVGEAQIRRVRPHYFVGARNPKLVESSLKIEFDQNKSKLTITNKMPHKVPTGFGSRAIYVNLTYKRKNEKISFEHIPLKAVFLDKNGEPTLSYVAQSLKEDTRLYAYEKREISLQIPQEATSIDVNIAYYLVDPDLLKRLNLEKNGEYSVPKKISEKSFILE